MKKKDQLRTSRITIAVTKHEKEVIEKKYGNSAVMRYVLLTNEKPNLVD